MAYLWAAIIGGVIVSAMLSQASGDQPVLVGVLGAIAGMFVLMVIRASRAVHGARFGYSSDSTASQHRRFPDSMTLQAAARVHSKEEQEMPALRALTDRLASLYPGWDARITQFDNAIRAVQIDHFPGLSTVLFTLVDGKWAVLPLLLDSSGEPIPGGPEPHALGTGRDQLDETVARIVRAEVEAYQRTAQPDSNHHASRDVSIAMRQRALEALRFF